MQKYSVRVCIPEKDCLSETQTQHMLACSCDAAGDSMGREHGHDFRRQGAAFHGGGAAVRILNLLSENLKSIKKKVELDGPQGPSSF